MEENAIHKWRKQHVQKTNARRREKKFVKTRNDENKSNEGKKYGKKSLFAWKKTKEAHGYYTSTE